MKSKTGAKVLVGLLYSQALFGLVAVAAVIVKDPDSQTVAHASFTSAAPIAAAQI